MKHKGILPNSSYEASITLLVKSDKDTTRKQNYRPVTLKNIDEKLLNQYQQTEFNNTLKAGHNIIKWDLSQV